MRLRDHFALVGVVVGAGMGVLAAYGVVIVGASATWLLVYGDESWPDYIAWAIPAAGIIGGVIVWSAVVLVATRHGRRFENAAPEVVARQRRLAYLLLATGVLFDATLAGAVVTNQRKQDEARRTAEIQRVWFAEFLAGRQAIHDVLVQRHDGQGSIAVTLRTGGVNRGEHRLVWRVRETLHDKTLAQGEAVLGLTGGLRDTALTIDAPQLADAYHRLVLGGAEANVLVDEDFVIEARLVPQLDTDVLVRMPRSERQNYENGSSDLIATAEAPLPIRFTIRGRTITLGR